MRFYVIATISYLALFTPGLANWQPYIGAGVGISKSQNSLKEFYASNIGAGSQTVNIGDTGTSESVLLGLRKQFACFFVGGELFTNFHQLAKTKKGPELFDADGPLILLNFKLKQKYSNGFSMYIGKDLLPCVDIFFKMDFFLSKFKMQYYHPERNTTGTQSKQIFGFAPGFALQANVTEQFRVRLDYAYRIYNSFKTKNISQEILVGNTSIRGKVVPRVHQVMCNFIYAF